MRYSLRQKRLREQRSAFFFFVGAAFVYLVAGLPLAAGKLAAAARAPAQHVLPPFAAMDRNGDGYVDSSEAARFPGYAPAFFHEDRNADGRLDAAEFAAARKRLERVP